MSVQPGASPQEFDAHNKQALKAQFNPSWPMNGVLRFRCCLPLNARRTSKRGSPERDCLFVKLDSWECLELLDHPHVPEPPDVIIETARVADGVGKSTGVESKRRWRLLIEDVVHTNSESGVVEDSLPARHDIWNQRRFLLFAHHFLAALGIPRHRRRFYRRREDQGIGSLHICKPGRMDVVLLKDPIKLGGKNLFPETIQQMHGRVQIPI